MSWIVKRVSVREFVAMVGALVLLPLLLSHGNGEAQPAVQESPAPEAAPPPPAPVPERKLYAHYMGCYPVAFGATLYHRTNDAHEISHDSEDFVKALGGSRRDWYLAPHGLALNREQSAELDIKRAMRAGVDGFAIDAWAGGDEAKKTMDALFAAAEKNNLKFEVTICIDVSCLPGNKKESGNNIQAVADAVKYVLEHHGSSPNLARRNGKPLIFGYGSYSIYQTQEMQQIPEGPQKWQRTVDAYKEVERLAGMPLFFHYCLLHYGHHACKKDFRKESFIDYAAYMGKHFGAVGAFFEEGAEWHADALADEATLSTGVKAGGAEWSQPMWFQYNNVGGSLYCGKGTDILRERWERARKYDSSLIQFATWNDYGEDTILAPAINTGYSILELNAYFTKWWKEGKAPTPEKDEIFLTYKKFPKGSETYPFKSRRSADGVVEVLTILTKEANVSVPGRGDYTAPAGLFVKQFPLTPGPVSAELSRGGALVLRLDSPEPVTGVPFREDNSMYSVSSGYDQQWRIDFADAPVFHYSEYGDADNDGLPNWFEMYWFGKWLDYSTMTAADPNADPDNDGATNLQEFKARTNPVKPPPYYANGFVWNLMDISKAEKSFNPDEDAQGSTVWSYLYRQGEYGKMDRMGTFEKCPQAAYSTPYTGKMAHLSPSAGTQYKDIHGWTCWSRVDGAWRFIIKPRRESMIALAWKSPVDGVVTARLSVEGSSEDLSTLLVRHGAETLLDEKIGAERKELATKEIRVGKGDEILFIGDAFPGNGTQSLGFTKFEIEMK
jgi:hypothetical protein